MPALATFQSSLAPVASNVTRVPAEGSPFQFQHAVIRVTREDGVEVVAAGAIGIENFLDRVSRIGINSDLEQHIAAAVTVVMAFAPLALFFPGRGFVNRFPVHLQPFPDSQQTFLHDRWNLSVFIRTNIEQEIAPRLTLSISWSTSDWVEL